MRPLAPFLLALAWPLAAGAQPAPDIRNYPPATLQQATSGAPKSRDAAFELEPTERRVTIAATYTGNARPPNTGELMPLVSAWMERRRRQPNEAGPAVRSEKLSDFPEIELEEGGKRYWLLLGYPAITNMTLKAGDPAAALVHRIGFAKGRAILVIYAITTPERMREAQAMPPPAPATPKPAPAGPVATARFTQGEIRFEFAGRSVRLPAYKAEYKQYEKFFSGMLDFGSAPTDAVIDFMIPGPGEHSTSDNIGFGMHFRLGGAFTSLSASDFPGCKLKVARLDPKGIRGRMDCAAKPPSGVANLEFEVAP